MRTGRPGKVQWTKEQEDVIREMYPKYGSKKTAETLGVSAVALGNRARYMGLRLENKFKWTADAIAILKAKYTEEGPTKVAEELNASYWAVVAKARRLKIESTRKLPTEIVWTDEMIEMLKRRYVEEGGDKLAEEFGFRLDVVRRKASSLGLHTIAGHKRWGRKRAETSESVDIRYFDTWSANMTYILGFIFADGNVNKKKTTVAINLHRDDESVLRFIKKETKSKHKLRRFQRDGCDPRTGRHNGPQSGLSITSVLFVESLIRRGVHPRKTYRDDPFPNVPDEWTADFVRGYLDGDGFVSVTSKDRCGIGFVGSPKFIIGLRDVLVKRIGLRTVMVRTVTSETGQHARVSWSSVEDIKLLYAFLYPKGHGFCLQRKKSKAKKWLSVERFTQGERYYNRHTKSMCPVDKKIKEIP